MTRRVLVLSPHTDDGELGAGGTIAHLAAGGAIVDIVAFSTGTANEDEAEAAASILGVKPDCVTVRDYKTRFFSNYRQRILDDLIRLRDLLQPEIVLCPSRHDRHQDHEVIASEAWRAFRTRTTILGYELPWSCPEFHCQMLVPLDKPDIAKKMVAIQKYKSQRHRPYAKNGAVYSLARVRGMQVGIEFAEAFEVLRWVDRGEL